MSLRFNKHHKNPAYDSYYFANRIRKFKRKACGVKLEVINNVGENYGIAAVIEKFAANPRCYLTGRPINHMDNDSWGFDHIIPSARGGTNDLANLGFACREANQAKSNMTPEELFALCKEILEHNGYKVEKPA